MSQDTVNIAATTEHMMGKKKYYAIVEGYKPGIYDEWFGSDG